jgi:hypothetical protein
MYDVEFQIIIVVIMNCATFCDVPDYSVSLARR